MNLSAAGSEAAAAPAAPGQAAAPSLSGWRLELKLFYYLKNWSAGGTDRDRPGSTAAGSIIIMMMSPAGAASRYNILLS